ncbi:MAG TPA: hypothetical protein DEP71_07320 [Porphyromonadaceae bacterium]|nr:hypothetical protein [Porphyromonadaceae bacterium]
MKAEENKFKGIRVDNGEWVYGDLVHYFFIKNGERADYVSIGVDLDFYDVIPETVCQFTTLKDKNGVEIYRDDKFQYRKHKGYLLDDFIGVVKFKDGCFGYESNRDRLFTPFSEFDELKEDFLDHIEVVGNVHDKQQQKQALIDMMRGDEEIGLYDDKINNNELHTN